MGEQRNLFFKEPPKKLEYLLRLYNFNETDTLQKTKNFLISQERTKAYSISEWCEIVDSPENEHSKQNNSIRDFLKEIKKHDALVKEKVRGQPPNETVLYRLDKKALRSIYFETGLYKMLKELNIDTINSEERFKSVITDINLN